MDHVIELRVVRGAEDRGRTRMPSAARKLGAEKCLTSFFVGEVPEWCAYSPGTQIIMKLRTTCKNVWLSEGFGRACRHRSVGKSDG